MKTRIMFPLILLALLIMSGCGSHSVAAPTATPTATEVPTFTPVPPTATPLPPTSTPTPPCGLGDTATTFGNYTSWIKVNSKPIKGHEVMVNIFVDDLAKDTYFSASGGTFPVCSKIVKTHLAGNSDIVTALTVMVKMPAGFDPAHHNWWWGMYDAKGEKAQMSGKVDVCIACHVQTAAEDYVFSKKVLEESQK